MCSLDSYIERLKSLDTSFFCASAVPVFVHVTGTQTVVGDTAHWCARMAMWANFSLPPSMVLVIMCSLPNVNPSVVYNKEFVFPGISPTGLVCALVCGYGDAGKFCVFAFHGSHDQVFVANKEFVFPGVAASERQTT